MKPYRRSVPGHWLLAVVLGATAGFALVTASSDSVTTAAGNAPLPARITDSPLVAGLTVHPIVSLDSETGTATVSGTIRCQGGQSFIGGSLMQQAGESVVEGFFSVDGVSLCDGTRRTWTAEVSTIEGRFEEGRATASVEGASCGVLFCDSALVQRTVRLR